VKRHAATVTNIVSISMHPLKCVISRTARHASVIQMVKQTM
jgi:hypothetical protein